MPKIVNHKTYHQEIIQKATELFVKQGYEGLGIGALDASQTRYYVRVSRSPDVLLMPREMVDTLVLGAEGLTT